MEWSQIEGNWKQLKGKVQETWGSLTDSEIDQIQGRKEQLVGKIQATYGKTKEQAEKEIDTWRKSLDD